MIRRLTKYLGLVAIAGGAFLVATPALAYTDTAPGSGASASSSSAAAGSPFTVTATFTDLAPGTTVTFSGTASGSCALTFNPASAQLNASHQASTTVTTSAGCAGQNVTVVATGPAGQTVSVSVAITGGFPNTTTAPVPFGWIVMAIGAVLVLAGIAGVAWRRNPLAAGA